MFTKILVILIALIIVFFVYYYVQIQRKISVSQALVKNTVPFELISNDFTNSLLVIGDSTAVGVGTANPSQSTPALISKLVGATYVENKAVSGAKINDVQAQIEKSTQKEYTHILLQIGANNVVARQSVESAEQDLRALLTTLPPHQKLTVLMCGNVGAATLFPSFVRPYYTKKNIAYHAMSARVVPEFEGTYVNLYTPKVIEPFIEKPEVYLAKDQFHPSSAGYQLWIDEVARILK